MTKRKTDTTRKEDDGSTAQFRSSAELVAEVGDRAWTGRPVVKAEPPKPAGEVLVRCVWHTRVVVSPAQTLSGMRYEFEPGEVRGVRKVDADRVLSLVKKQAANCCGPGAPPVLHYFERA